MKLEDIGFYTLSDKRAENVSDVSDLQRCELLITSKCNFKCPYCRGTDKSADITFEQAKHVVDLWAEDNLHNIRFSGGEPTVVKWLPDIVKYAHDKGIDRIAISSNGSASQELYDELISLGANDFSISLDACCAEVGDKMAGGIKGSWETVIANIKYISSKTYTTVGVVLTKETISTINDVIKFAHGLGVSDIRIITAAQWNEPFNNVKIDQELLDMYPILKYRWDNIRNGVGVRGITKSDTNKCGLVLDDMAIYGDNHYPCIIKMREGCVPIGKVSDIKTMRAERLNYFINHDSYCDEICKKNCLDVCIEHNNKVASLIKYDEVKFLKGLLV